MHYAVFDHQQNQQDPSEQYNSITHMGDNSANVQSIMSAGPFSRDLLYQSS